MPQQTDDDRSDPCSREREDRLDIVVACAEEWDIAVADLMPRRSPLRSIAIEVGYPDHLRPLHKDGRPNVRFHTSGFRVAEGQDGSGSEELARWTRENSRDVMRFSIRRLTASVPGWEADEVAIRKTLSYDPGDPRVDLSSGGSSLVTDARTRDRFLAVSAWEVGGVYGEFVLNRSIPDAVSVELTIRLSDRIEKLRATKGSRSRMVWDLVSDKYGDETTFSYELHLTADGPDFSDETIGWGTTVPVAVNLPPGLSKQLGIVQLTVPSVPPDRFATLNRYVKDFMS